jgi:hypothetical protein
MSGRDGDLGERLRLTDRRLETGFSAGLTVRPPAVD